MINKGTLSVVLTVVGCVGTVATAFMAIHETPRAIQILDEHRLQVDPSGETDLCWQEKALDYGKGYWKTAVVGGVTIAAQIGSCLVSHKAYKALMSASTAAAAIGAKYKDKAAELFGDEKARLLDNSVKKDLNDSEFMTKKVWFRESVSECCFQTTWKDIYEAEYEANRQLATVGYVCIGEIFPEIEKLAPKTAEWCWSQDMLIEDYGYPWLDFIHHLRNCPASEFGPIDWKLNDGRETYDITYGIYPMPPAQIKENGWLGPLD